MNPQFGSQCYPRPAGQAATDTISQVTMLIQVAAVVIGGGLAVYLTWPLLTGVRAVTEVPSEKIKARSRRTKQRMRQDIDYQDDYFMPPTRQMSARGSW